MSTGRFAGVLRAHRLRGASILTRSGWALLDCFFFTMPIQMSSSILWSLLPCGMNSRLYIQTTFSELADAPLLGFKELCRTRSSFSVPLKYVLNSMVSPESMLLGLNVHGEAPLSTLMISAPPTVTESSLTTTYIRSDSGVSSGLSMTMALGFG
jgi:hypothetical protein